MEQLVSGMGWDGKGTNPVHLAGHKRLYACEACPSAVGPARFHASLCGGVGQLVDCIASFCYPLGGYEVLQLCGSTETMTQLTHGSTSPPPVRHCSNTNAVDRGLCVKHQHRVKTLSPLLFGCGRRCGCRTGAPLYSVCWRGERCQGYCCMLTLRPCGFVYG
jgi:hypothetical protein